MTPGEPRSIRCSTHGLIYDPATASGCLRCRKELPEQTCTSCRRPIPSSLAICPACGTLLGAKASPAFRPRIALLAGGALALAAVIFLLARPSTNTGADWHVQVERIADPTRAPRDPQAQLLELTADTQPPAVELAIVRTTGSREYAAATQKQPADLAITVWQALREMGANAFRVEAPNQIGKHKYEVAIHAFVVHAGAVRREDFPDGRACLIVSVKPGSAAENGGLRGDDLVTRVGEALPRGREPCETVYGKLAAAAVGASIELAVLRAGEAQTLTLVRASGLYGYAYFNVPVLAP